MKHLQLLASIALAANFACGDPGAADDTVETDGDPRSDTGTGLPRHTDGLQILYTFDEGDGFRVTDTSGIGEPADLTIGDPESVVWGDGFLSVGRATIIRALKSPQKLLDAMAESQEFTMEIWFRSADLEQAGPARIVTYSGPTSRNFALFQSGLNYESRLYTDVDPNNAVNSGPDSVYAELTHLVYTRDINGTATIYIDGYEQATLASPGNFETWDPDAELALANNVEDENRPWLGSYYRMAIYSSAFGADEVSQNFFAGP